MTDIEPVAWMTDECTNGKRLWLSWEQAYKFQKNPIPLYISPFKKLEWVGLNDEKIYKVFDKCQMQWKRPPTEDAMPVFARAIEAKLKELNHD